ncbi:META domain-containing protein [Pseudomaricurvus sp. HS19]|uniref:META domain-containing protein n=1 Tax=Pseudomaricurvus sp. HS19 TaxID=2692626 RepID=UPI00136ABE96|nr:META domain-containing protein [Pseudomaricurvus sp. HS19]MYM64303.1 META domain-containing protein [Pseudomaricurvus sp. HS19]
MKQSESVDGKSLVGSNWQIESVDSGGIIDNSMITASFPEQGRISGSTGCNRYMGNFVVSGEGAVQVTGMGSTRRACPEALMNQESRVLEALQATTQVKMEGSQWLLFLDSEGKQRLKMIAVEP